MINETAVEVIRKYLILFYEPRKPTNIGEKALSYEE
jgi:hypothetical protein